MRRWRPRWRPGKLLQGQTVRHASAAAAAPWAARARCVRFQAEAWLIVRTCVPDCGTDQGGPAGAAAAGGGPGPCGYARGSRQAHAGQEEAVLQDQL